MKQQGQQELSPEEEAAFERSRGGQEPATRPGNGSKEKKRGTPPRQQAVATKKSGPWESLSAPEKKSRIKTWLNGEVDAMIQALPFDVPEEAMLKAATRFKVFFGGIPSDSKVWACTNESLSLCIAKSALTGCFPGGPSPDVDLIPRSGVLDWQMGFHGYVNLCRRNPGWDIDCVPVWTVDDFEEGFSTELGATFQLSRGGYEPGESAAKDEESLRGVLVWVTQREHGEVIGRKHRFLSKADILKRKACAQTKDVWNKWFVEQSVKTGLRYAGQRALFPLTPGAREALAFEAENDQRIVAATLQERPAAGLLLEAGDA